MTKVLIVDDELEVRQFLSSSLSNCGYAIREARDGSEALACVATDHPDVVITDVLMPVMDGFELALRIRANPDSAGTEVIFFTGRASPRQIQAMAETAGVHQVVRKPATMGEVRDAVDAAIHRKHPSSPLDSSALNADQQRVLIAGITAARQRSQDGDGASQEGDLRFRILFARSLDAMLLVDSNGQCLEANPSTLALLGCDLDTLAARTLWSFVSPDSQPALRETWRRLLTEGRIQGRFHVLRPDGARQEMELSAVADLEPGKHFALWRPVGGL
jgi:PAS domain S-box-containing protein